MLLDEKTIAILSNFQTINQNLIIKPGNKLRTMSKSETVVAMAVTDSDFEDELYIHDLSKLLAILSLSQENIIKRDNKDLVIVQGKSQAKYRLSDPILFKTFPDTNIKFTTPYIEFSLPWVTLSNAIKAMQILKFNELSFSGDGEKLYISAISVKNPDDNSYSTEIGENKKVFNCIIELEKLKLVPSDYYVRITSKGLVHFKGDNIEYYIAMNNKSEFK
jgi:hypothetical protein